MDNATSCPSREESNDPVALLLVVLVLIYLVFHEVWYGRCKAHGCHAPLGFMDDAQRKEHADTHALANQSILRDGARVEMSVEQGNVRVRKSFRWGEADAVLE
ncbi:hypothetical protein G7Y79_00056g090250 [Physcia stellaris]|nr:hypothetical protein G7Y79_00056g090250 [Physcia stellaris]